MDEYEDTETITQAEKLAEVAHLAAKTRVFDDLLRACEHPSADNFPKPEMLWLVSDDLKERSFSKDEYEIELETLSHTNQEMTPIARENAEQTARKLSLTAIYQYIEATKEGSGASVPEDKVLVAAIPLLRGAQMELDDHLRKLITKCIKLDEPGSYDPILTAIMTGGSEFGKVYLLNELTDILSRNTTISIFDKTVTKQTIIDMLEEMGISQERLDNALDEKPKENSFG